MGPHLPDRGQTATVTSGTSVAIVWRTGCLGPRKRRLGGSSCQIPAGRQLGRSEARMRPNQAPGRSLGLARSGHIHLGYLRCVANLGTLTPPPAQELVAVARLGVGDPSKNRQIRCAQGAHTSAQDSRRRSTGGRQSQLPVACDIFRKTTGLGTLSPRSRGISPPRYADDGHRRPLERSSTPSPQLTPPSDHHHNTDTGSSPSHPTHLTGDTGSATCR